jgi:hypothetical protein
MATDVLRAAVAGYRDLVTENFAASGSALGLASALPVQIAGTLVMPGDDPDGTRTSLHYQLIPAQSSSRDPVTDIQLKLVTAPGTRPPGARIAAFRYDRRRNPFYVPSAHTTWPPPIGQSRPATNLAYQWLSADLDAAPVDSNTHHTNSGYLRLTGVCPAA